MNNPELIEGAKFDSFELLSQAIERWENMNFVKLYKRRSRTIDAAAKRVTKKVFNERLKYSEIDYACIHGGRTARTTSTGIRPNQKTILKGCNFQIKVRVTLDGQNLYIKDMSENQSHNHSVDKETFQYLPQQRRLTKDECSEVASMLKMKANKKLIQEYAQSTFGKVVSLKDIHNVATKSGAIKENSLKELVEEMKKCAGASVDVYADQNNVLQAIAFQTEEMRSTFSAYPEVLLIDATYKLNDLRMPLYVLQSVDGNGESEIICFWLVACEDLATISFLMEKFKERNSNWSKVQVIMADKDMTERNVMAEKLPNASILICLFHTLRSFRREISIEKMGISVGDRNLSLELLQKITNAKSEVEYFYLYEDFTDSVPRCVVDYFNKNWHDIRSQWVEGLKNKTANFLNNTNNSLESINKKLKSVISRYSVVTLFFQDLMKAVKTLKNERDLRAAQLILKTPTLMATASSVEQRYAKMLTPFAFKHLKNQLDSFDKINVIKKLDSDSVAIRSKSLGDITVQSNFCPCSFFTSLLLPCKHVFAARRHLKLELFEESLCSVRWTQSYCKDNQRLLRSLTTSDHSTQAEESVVVNMIPEPQNRGAQLSEQLQQQKYRRAHDVLISIAQIMSEQGQKEFDYNMKVINTLKEYLQEGKHAVVLEMVQSAGVITALFFL